MISLHWINLLLEILFNCYKIPVNFLLGKLYFQRVLSGLGSVTGLFFKG